MSRAEVLAHAGPAEMAAIALLDLGCVRPTGVRATGYRLLMSSGHASRDARGCYRPTEKLWNHARDVWGIERARTIQEVRLAA